MASLRNTPPSAQKISNEIEKQEKTPLESFMGNQEINNRPMSIKQEINYTDDECKFKIENNAASSNEVRGEDVLVVYETTINAVKQEITELGVNDVDPVDCGKQSVYLQYNDVSGEKLFMDIDSNDDLVIKEEDIKISVSQWVDSDKSEITYSEENKASKASSEVKFIHNLKNFKCLYCSYETDHKADLNYHIKMQHDVSTVFWRCDNCLYQTKDKVCLKNHIKTQHQMRTPLLKCSSCLYETKSKKTLRYHIRKHGMNSPVFGCAKCVYTTKIRQSLINHIRISHDKVIHKCPHCSYKIKNYKCALKRHIREHHDETAAVYKCPECAYESKNMNSLRKHIRHMHNENAVVHKCSKCSYATKHKENLKRHSKLHDENAAVYKCSECSYVGKCKYYFTLHNKMYHSKDGVYKCSECSYVGKCKDNLTRHNKMYHSEDSVVYKCSKCLYATKWKNSLPRHMKLKHYSGVYKCSDCHFETKYKNHFTRHKRKHDKNACNL